MTGMGTTSWDSSAVWWGGDQALENALARELFPGARVRVVVDGFVAGTPGGAALVARIGARLAAARSIAAHHHVLEISMSVIAAVRSAVDEDGIAVTKYGLQVARIAVALVVVTRIFGTAISSRFSDRAGSITPA